ncbi:MAG: flagellar protein FlaG [Bacillota bacterium]
MTLAEVNLRHLDMFAEAQRAQPQVHVYSRARLSGLKEEAGSKAQGPGAQGDADAADRQAGPERAQEEGELRAKLLAESVVSIRVAFHVDNETGDVTIKVIDNMTGEVVRYIPPEELAAMTEKLKEFAGLVVDKKR